MAVWREHYWQQLSAAERARALDEGKRVYAEYGDAAAKPRLEHQLLFARLDIPGFLTPGQVSILLPSSDGALDPSGEHDLAHGVHYYDAQYWDPKRYWQWTDQHWKELPQGKVSVGTLRSASPSEEKP